MPTRFRSVPIALAALLLPACSSVPKAEGSDGGGLGNEAGRSGPDGAAAAVESGNPDGDSATDGGEMAPVPAAVFTCGAIVASSLAPDGSSDAIEADLLTGDQTDRVVDNGASFAVAFTTRVAAADTVSWQIVDDEGGVLQEGQFPVAAGTSVHQVPCRSTLAGYFATTATLMTAGGTLQARGSRPAGIMTFGVMPSLASVLGNAVYAHLDDHRFGIEGTTNIQGVWLEPVYSHLGLVWAYDNRDWSNLEPNASGQYDPVTYPTMTAGTERLAPAQYAQDGLLRYITVDGIPAWASSSGTATDSYPPASFDAYGTFLGKVAQEQVADLKYFPKQQHDYYQVTWEPDPGTGNQWLGTPSEFVQLYQTAYTALHASDAHAVVLGPTELYSSDGGYGVGPNFARQPISLYNPDYAGLAQALDGLSLHGYYGGDVPEDPPEATTFIPALRAVRHAVATLLPPHAPVISSESGTAYAGDYSPTYPGAPYLVEHAATIVRSHLIMIGEGVDVTFFFYTADYSTEHGFGMYFNLTMPQLPVQGGWGSGSVSPKPAAMAVAAMTQALDGSVTLGPFTHAPSDVYAYAFQRTGGPIVTALWAYAANYGARVSYALTVGSPGSHGTVVVIDGMGNPKTVSYANGQVSLTLGDLPQYVVSTDVAAIRAQVTTPEGYDPSL